MHYTGYHTKLLIAIFIVFSCHFSMASETDVPEETVTINTSDIVVKTSTPVNQESFTRQSSVNNNLVIEGGNETINYSPGEKTVVESRDRIVFKPGTKIISGAELHASIIVNTPEEETHPAGKIAEIAEKRTKTKNNKPGTIKKGIPETKKEESLNSQLLFLVTTYEELIRSNNKTTGVINTNRKKDEAIISSLDAKGITSERQQRYFYLKEIPFEFKISEITQNHLFNHAGTGFNQPSFMILRL